ncbi:MAG TPA: DUF1236 domain-containing protein [Bradyrhizobium sp.]|jgi:hypothetical protein|nr:DUF1236 domain-containing protein [Bradyrhizobium sp.]
MSNRYLMSVAAAALIAGTGFANAQGAGGAAPATGATTQQSAPSERGAPSAATPMNRDASQSGAPAEAPKSAQSKDMAPKGEKSAQDSMKGEKSKSMSSESKDGMKNDAAKNADSKGAADSKGTADNKAGSSATDSKTTGNAATSATAAPPAEKRSQIASAIKSEKIQETTNVNFNISVGATIPASVHFYPLPPRIVEIYPEWRGYEVIRVHGRYVIVRPQTREIVYIIEG